MKYFQTFNFQPSQFLLQSQEDSYFGRKNLAIAQREQRDDYSSWTSQDKYFQQVKIVQQERWDDCSYWIGQDKYFSLKILYCNEAMWENYEYWIEKDEYFQAIPAICHEEQWDVYSDWVSIIRI